MEKKKDANSMNSTGGKGPPLESGCILLPQIGSIGSWQAVGNGKKKRNSKCWRLPYGSGRLGVKGGMEFRSLHRREKDYRRDPIGSKGERIRVWAS